ncbi:MAG: amidase [Acidimicrobiia bacterium]
MSAPSIPTGPDGGGAPDETELRSAGVVELAAALAAGRTTSVALLECHLAATDRLDPLIGAYLRRFDDEARAAAERLDAERRAGDVRSILHGIPIGMKDILATDEGPTTAQSLALDPAWGEGGDGPVVARLRAAGAIICGKTSTMEFAIGFPDPRLHRRDTSEAEAHKPFPLPRNPWDLGCWTGGSSSGTAAGVAAGLFPAGIGTDTAGSVRLPAGYCGVTGHKPTFGLVPKNGCVPLGLTYDHIGPLARTARDCAALLEVMAGPDPGDPTSVAGPAGGFLDGIDAGLAGVRIGVARSATVGDGTASPAVAACFEQAVADLRAAGAEVVDVTFPLWGELLEGCFSGLFAEAFAWHRPMLAERWADYGVDTRRGIAQGALISAADYVQIQRVREVGRQRIAELFGEVDLIATPTTGTTALRYDSAGGDREVRLRTLYTPPYNSLGLPAIALPMGLADGLPASLQLAGRWFEDALVLRAGAAYQDATTWHRMRPPAW